LALGALASLLVVGFGAVLAQAPPPMQERGTGWLALNLGYTVGGPWTGMYVASADLDFQRRHHWFGVRASAMLDEFYGDESVAELGLLYGLAARHGSFHVLGGIGLAYVSVCREVSGELDCRKRLGIPLTGRLSVRPLPLVGIGAQPFGNMNSIASVTAWTVFVELGKLR
jgi:hypothetical protein